MDERLDAVAQATLVADRTATPVELVEAAIRRIEALNPRLNAVVYSCFESALEHATIGFAGAGAPLAGVPFLLKGSGATQAGVPSTRGNIALKDLNHVPRADTPLGERFRTAGLVTLGVSNLPEFGLLGDTQPSAFGPTRNPWDADRSVGGSSGGAAAAVAAGMVPLAHANDSAGSIRAPACWCGLLGLKPSRGRVPRPVGTTDIWGTEFVLARTVRDLAVTLDGVEGALVGELYSLPRPTRSYFELLREPPPGLRVGVLIEGRSDAPLSAECKVAIKRTATLLERAGHEIVDEWPRALLEEAPSWVDPFRRSYFFHGAVDDLARDIGRPVTEADVEPYTWTHYEQTSPLSAEDLHRYLHWHLTRAGRILEWWDGGFDLLLAPVLNGPAEALTELAGETPREMAVTEKRHAAYLEPFNASGQPAISVPTDWTADGLPMGVQLIAQRGREDLLLQVAATLEEATGWAARWPTLA